MDLVTLCPFVASKVVWQAYSGAFALTVIVKATFVLRPGTAELAPEQDPICERDRFFDDDPRKSVRVPCDVAPYKPRADVLLVGHAYAPGKQAVRSIVTRFVVGEVDKSIEVWCDRAFRIHDGQFLEGQRFTQMPLSWERTSGGPESLNPVGRPFDGPPDAYGTIAIGNLQPLGHFVSKRSDTFVPTCYAPVSPTWPGRTQRLGRLSRTILDGAWNVQPMPVDLDPMFFQVAPPDQHVAEIRPNERIRLENLHPEHARLVTSLPGLRPRAIADRATGEREEVALVGDTLWVDTDRGVCCVVWRGRMGLRHPQEAGRIAIWVDGMPMEERMQPRQTLAVVEDAPEVVTTIAPVLSSRSNALPFAAGTSVLAQSAPILHEKKCDDDGTGTMLVWSNNLGGKAIPFEPRRPSNAKLEETVPQQRVTNEAMMFVTPSIPEPTLHLTDPYADERIPFVQPVVEERRPKALAVEVEPEKKVEFAPPMIGPIMRTEFIESARTDFGHVPTVGPSVSPGMPGEDTSPVDFDIHTLERCASVAACKQLSPDELPSLLKKFDITQENWHTAHSEWLVRIKDDMKRGGDALLRRYDQAFLTELERTCGAIDAERYARLLIAFELGNLSELVNEWRIPMSACSRIRRHWTRRLTEEPELARAVRIAMDAAED